MLRAALFSSVVLVSATLAGCTMGESASPEGAWRVVALDGTSIEPADDVTLTLQDGQASGRSGCNRYNGSYTLDDGFAFGALASTRMACRGRGGEIEAQFNTIVDQVNGWRLDNGVLELLDGERAVLRAVLEP
ncbi:META domain-containing protein [Pararhodobacter zhoushanensis]|uniref:META domain-containing protein n=1 Tax=Pararhodobacter zhoushanensis TaxID=2479545 RepID=UPI000F8CACA4|nr:META domain-containing protein [Pararhodobacter zhoushanensis]